MQGMRRALPGFALLAALWLPAAAEIYKCTDAAGTVQYSDRPCAGQASIITPATAPGVDPHAAGRRQREGKLLQAFEAERAEERRAQEEAGAQELQRQRNCERARDWVARLSTVSRIYRLDEEGARVDVPEAERAATLSRAQANVRQWCAARP